MSYEISKNITVRHTEDDVVSMTNSDKVPNWYDNWDKLQFLLEEDEDPHTEQLYDLLNEILYRIENLEKNLICTNFNCQKIKNDGRNLVRND